MGPASPPTPWANREGNPGSRGSCPSSSENPRPAPPLTSSFADLAAEHAKLSGLTPPGTQTLAEPTQPFDVGQHPRHLSQPLFAAHAREPRIKGGSGGISDRAD